MKGLTMSDERDRVAADEPEVAAPSGPEEVESDDFALRNAAMSNAIPGAGQPAAGAVVGSREKILEPTTDEERVAEDSSTPER